MSNGKPKIIAIVGPTASGKTPLSVEIARRFKGEVVSADSRQVYRGLDIGTGKITRREMRGVPHHLLDIKNPNEPYTVADYKRDALRAIRAILKKKKLPILVGGTGLYVRAVTENLDIPRVKQDVELRRNLEARIEEKGLGALFRELVRLDPEVAYIVDPKNPRRVVRALEVVLQTGKPFSAQRTRGKPLFAVLKIGIALPKEALQKRITERVRAMVRKGLFREVKNLVAKYGPDCRALDAIGYREIIAHLEGKLSLAEAVELTKRNTSRYAKRQMTWFRKDREIWWVNSAKQAERIVKEFLKN